MWSAAIAILGGLSTFPAFENKTAAAGLAVLPVVNQTNSPEIDYVAKGIHSELVRRMRGVRELHVYELPAVGLNARFPEAERLQFSLKSNFARRVPDFGCRTQLTSNPDKRAVWSDQFQGSTADSLGLETRASDALVNAVKRLSRPKMAGIPIPPIADDIMLTRAFRVLGHGKLSTVCTCDLQQRRISVLYKRP